MEPIQVVLATLAIIAAVWALCGVVGYGITLAYFAAEHPTYSSRDVAWIVGIAGPIGLLVAVPKSGWCKHGLRYRYKPPVEWIP